MFYVPILVRKYLFVAEISQKDLN